MNFTESFQRQHDDILAVANEVSILLDEEQVKTYSEELIRLLLKFGAKIEAHLTLEDKILYPKLYDHSNLKVRQTAKQFFEEMGGLSCVFKAYSNKWNSSLVISSQAKEFIKETKELFDALSKRIDKENQELYPLANK